MAAPISNIYNDDMTHTHTSLSPEQSIWMHNIEDFVLNNKKKTKKKSRQ